MFFEGSEKKIEVNVHPESSLCLRELKKDYWHKLVKESGASILSVISNNYCDAYILSESSLFVWDKRFLMITCGKTTLVDAFVAFIEEFGKEKLPSLIYQRKNEYYSFLQKSDFYSDVEKYKKYLPGVSHRFGYLDRHHTNIFHSNNEFDGAQDDFTTELLMYHINDRATAVFSKENQEKNVIRDFLGIDQRLSGFQIDDFAFDPLGYSLNGIKDKNYFTIHVTPEEDSSYVSFETNCDLSSQHPRLLENILDLFQPESFDFLTFNSNQQLVLDDSGYHLVGNYKDDLDCGYQVRFFEYIKEQSDFRKSIRL